MRAQHPRHLLHRLDAAAQSAPSPVFEKLSGVARRFIAPEVFEEVFERPSSRCGQFAVEQSPQLPPGLPAHPTGPPQQFPTHLLEPLGLSPTRRPQLSAFGATHLVQGLIEIGGDVKAVQHMQRLAGSGGDDPQIRLPHIAAYKTQPRHYLRSQRLQTPPQRGLGAPLAHPQQTPAVPINLVNHCQEIVRSLGLAPVQFVHADGFDPLQFAVRQTPAHKPLHRAIDTFPTGLEGPRGLAPRQPSRPPRQEAHHRRRHRPFALVPGHLLDHYPVLGTVHPPRRIQKPRHNPPQRNKQPPPRFQPVITGGHLTAPRALGPNALVGLQRDLNPTRSPFAVPMEPHVLVNKTAKMLNRVQNGLNLQLHSWFLGRGVGPVVFQLADYPNTRRSAIALLRQPALQALLHKQFHSGASWRRAGRSRWGPRYGGSPSFGFPGLRGRKAETLGYRYGGDLDGPARSHTLARRNCLKPPTLGR